MPGIGIRIGKLGGGSSGVAPWKPRYYVSNTGNDALDGLSPINAWRTIAKVNASSAIFIPGDKIGFQYNGVWRETLTVPTSGDSSNPITFGAYGAGGLLPKISGADVITGFAADTGVVGPELSPNVTFDSDVSGWMWNQITHEAGLIGGRSNMAKITAIGSSSVAAWAPSLALTTIPHTITFDVYMPSTNAKTNTIRIAEGDSTFAFIHDTEPIANTWTSVTIHRTPVTGNDVIYIYGARNGIVTDNAAGDVFYFDNFSVKADAIPLVNIWNVAVTTLPNIVLIAGVRGDYKTSKANCVASGDWYWAANVLSVYYASDPSGITEAGKRNWNVMVSGNYQSFRNIKFTANQTASMYGLAFSNIDIQYCTFDKIGGYIIGFKGVGIVVGGNDYVIKNNIFSDIHDNAIYNSGVNSNAVIEHNIFTDCWNHLEYPYGLGTSVDCADSVGWTIAYNYIIGCNKGISFLTGKSILCHHNIVVDSHVNGIDQYNGGVAGFLNYIYNNIVIHNPSGTAGHGIAVQGTGGYAVIKNNLVYITFIGINANVQGLCIERTNYSGIDIDNNLVYKIPGSTANLYTLAAGIYDYIADWKTALAGTAYSGKEVHAINADPLFVNFAGGDYHLGAGSPALGAGVDVGLGETNPNIGAL